MSGASGARNMVLSAKTDGGGGSFLIPCIGGFSHRVSNVPHFWFTVAKPIDTRLEQFTRLADMFQFNL